MRYLRKSIQTTIMLKFCLVFVILFEFRLSAKFPSDLPNCNYGDVDCIKDSLNEILPRVKNGLPGLNIIPINPIQLERLDLSQETGAVTINATCMNLKIYGIPDFRVTKVIGFDENPAESEFEVHGELERIQMVCDYNVNGRVLILPVDSTGIFNITGLETIVKIKFYPTTVQRNNKVYLQLKKFSFRPKTKMTHIQLTYNNDEIFGNTLQTFLNDNWGVIHNSLAGEFQGIGSSVMVGLINNVLMKVKYSDFFKNV